MTFQVDREAGLAIRQTALNNARRVVVKLGSAVLTNGAGLNREVIAGLAVGITALRQSGRQVILVSSGAVAAGRQMLGRSKGGGIREKQALAAAGQCTLMRTYEEVFADSAVMVAQVLLTHDDLAHRNRYLNARNTLFTLLDWRVLPIINENDTVSVEELRFGDNDTLAALITNLTEADVLVCLTDV
ncbi:MAG: glutamate 5-kinase, partial [Deltaproteobacteria bacterium CG_4_10_14_3_um_filter_60_8]